MNNIYNYAIVNLFHTVMEVPIIDWEVHSNGTVKLRTKVNSLLTDKCNVVLLQREVDEDDLKCDLKLQQLPPDLN